MDEVVPRMQRPFGLLVLILLVCANGSLQLWLGILMPNPFFIALAIPSFIVCYGLFRGDTWSWISALALDIFYLAAGLLVWAFIAMNQYDLFIFAVLAHLYPVLVLLIPVAPIFNNMPVVLTHMIPALLCFIPVIMIWYLRKSHVKEFFLAKGK